MISATLYDEKTVPPVRLRSSYVPAGLGPGEFWDVSNLRFGDGGLKVRKGTVGLLGLPAAGAVPRDLWEVELNGSVYVVGAYDLDVSGTVYTTFWYSESPYSSWTEITEAGGGTVLGWSGDSSGNSRMTSTEFVDVCVVRRGRYRSEGGTFVAGRDVLLMQNGTDPPRIWDPLGAVGLQCLVHAPIRVPDGADQFKQTASFMTFHQVAGSSGKNYVSSSGSVQQARYKFSTTSASPYTSGDQCILLTQGASAADGDIAAMNFTASITMLSQLVLLVEGISATDILSQAKIEISNAATGTYSSVTDWVTVFDPGIGSTQRIVASADSTSSNPRSYVAYPLTNVGNAKTFRWIRFTHKGATSPATVRLCTILMVASGGDLPNDCQWSVSYRNSFSFAESPAFVASQTFAKLSNCGGPTAVSTTNPNAFFTIVPMAGILYDYTLYVKNDDHPSDISGGVGATPDTVDFYLRGPGEEVAYHSISKPLYVPQPVVADLTTPRYWAHAEAGSIFSVYTHDEFGGYSPRLTLNTRDFSRTAPSAFQEAIPPARTCAVANGRLFVGAIRDVSGSAFERGDLYFSEYLNPFRMQSLQDSEVSGSRVVFEGQQVRKILATSASADGGSFVYVWTNKHLVALGGSAGSGGPAYTTSQLSQVQEISDTGTNSPRSVVSHRGALFYLGDEHQVIRVYGGTPEEISRLSVDDRLTAIPASRRPEVCGAYFGDRYYLGYSGPNDATNARLLIWNDVRGHWEADDLPPKSAERLARVFDLGIDGSGQRLFMMHSDGTVSAYEEGSTDAGADVAVRLQTGEISAASMPKQDAGRAVHHAQTYLDADAQAKELTLLTSYSNGGTSSNTVGLTEGFVVDTVHLPIVSSPPFGSDSGARSFNLTISGAMVAESRIRSIVVMVSLPNSIEAKAG